MALAMTASYTKETTTLLLDADILAYRYAAGGQKTFNWGGGVVSHDLVDVEELKVTIVDDIHSLMEDLEADEVIVCLTDNVNFRKTILPTYKSNRTGDKPILLGEVKDYLAARFKTYQRPTLEADDVMGILSTHPKIIEGRRIIVSQDKDMKTIPGWLYNPDKDVAPRWITEEEADYFHLYQTLTGDPVDGYKGCPKVGKVGAEKLLQEFPTWDAVVEQYKCKGLTEGDALVQARCARILRASDYDFKRKEVILWQPR